MLILKPIGLAALLASALLTTHGIADAKVKGTVDGVKSGVISGWACDSPNTKSIRVHIYAGGPAGSGTAIKSLTASRASSSTNDRNAIAAACGHKGKNGAHRFRWTIPDSVKAAHGGKKLYVHGIDLSGSPNLLLSKSGRFRVPDPSLAGELESFDDGIAKGWACALGSAEPAKVKAYAGNTLLGTFTTSNRGAASIDKTCRHAGRGRHHFAVPAPAGHAGKKLRLVVVSPRGGATKTLSGSNRFFMPGDATHIATRAKFVWDYSLTNHCSRIRATALSFPGADGTTHGPSRGHFDDIAKAVGEHCVRLIKVNIKRGGGKHSKRLGYWHQHSSYQAAGAFAANLLYRAEKTLKGNDGRRFIQGATIYIGSSAGAHIGAAALEWNKAAGAGLPTFNSLVDRSILVSGPLFADLSVGCALLTSSALRKRIDTIFRLGTRCLNSPAEIGSRWDVVKPNSSHSYLNNSAKQISVLVGKGDRIGCGNNGCGNWNAVAGMKSYTDALGGFSNRDVASGSRPHTYREINGDHDLWDSAIVRRLACRNILAEVSIGGSVANAACNSL